MERCGADPVFASSLLTELGGRRRSGWYYDCWSGTAVMASFAPLGLVLMSGGFRGFRPLSRTAPPAIDRSPAGARKGVGGSAVGFSPVAYRLGVLGLVGIAKQTP